MFTEETIKQNKETYINLINSINREGFNKETFLNMMENSDFFIAPASTKYHNSFKGGLCAHCLNVYNNLKKLVGMYNLSDEISNDSIIIVSLLHDISKRNLYELSFQNKKIYSEDGSKFDELGRFDWHSVPIYKVKEFEDRFVYGSHEETSEFMARSFIPLTYEESVAILHHMGGKSWDSAQDSLSEAFIRYPLACLLHIADVISTYVNEKMN